MTEEFTSQRRSRKRPQFGGLDRNDKAFIGFTIAGFLRQILAIVLGWHWFLGLPFTAWNHWGEGMVVCIALTLLFHFTGPKLLKYLLWIFTIMFLLLVYQTGWI